MKTALLVLLLQFQWPTGEPVQPQVCTVEGLDLPRSHINFSQSLAMAVARWGGAAYVNEYGTQYSRVREIGFFSIWGLRSPVVIWITTDSWRKAWNDLAIAECRRQQGLS